MVFGVSLISCDNDSISPKLTQWNFEIYQYGELNTRIEFAIEGGKIASYTSESYSEGDVTSSVYTALEFKDSKISASRTYNDKDELIKEIRYNYLENGELDEYLYNRISNEGVSKREYKYSRNNTFVEFDSYISEDGIHFKPDPYIISKRVQIFDDEDNQIVQTNYTPEDSAYTTIEYEFDSNNNLTKRRNTGYTYSQIHNPASDIMINTYGKRVFWLTPWILKNVLNTPFLISENTLTDIKSLISSESELDTYSIEEENGIVMSSRYVFSHINATDEIRNEFIYE